MNGLDSQADGTTMIVMSYPQETTTRQHCHLYTRSQGPSLPSENDSSNHWHIYLPFHLLSNLVDL